MSSYPACVILTNDRKAIGSAMFVFLTKKDVCLRLVGWLLLCSAQPISGCLNRHHHQRLQWTGMVHVDHATPARVTPALHGKPERACATFDSGIKHPKAAPVGWYFRWRRPPQPRRKRTLGVTCTCRASVQGDLEAVGMDARAAEKRFGCRDAPHF